MVLRGAYNAAVFMFGLPALKPERLAAEGVIDYSTCRSVRLGTAAVESSGMILVEEKGGRREHLLVVHQTDHAYLGAERDLWQPFGVPEELPTFP